MKKLYLFIIALFLFNLTDAQEQTKITSAGGISIAEAYLVKDIISVKEHGFLVFQSYTLNEELELEFQIYDLSRALTNRTTFRFDETKGEPYVHGYTEWNNHFLLFVSYFNEATSTNELYFYQYALPTLELLNSAKIMEAYSPIDLNIPFFYSTSKDESKLAISSWSYSIPKDPGKMDVRVFNKDFKIIKEYSYLMPYDNMKIYLKESIVDNNGNAYLIGKKHSGNTTFSYTQLESLPGDPFVLAFYTDKKEPNLYEIDVKKFRFPILEFSLNPQQELVGLGFYRIGGKKSFTGVCSFTVSPTDKSLKLNTSEISKDLLINALGDKPPNYKSAASFKYATIKDLILKDKAYYIVGENLRLNIDRQPSNQYQYSTVFGYNPLPFGNAQRYSPDYALLDMFVIKLNKQGTIVWMKRIPKEQQVGKIKTDYLSFSVLERERDILLFYNDHPDNLSFRPKDKVKKTEIRTAQPMLAKVHCSSGKVTKRKLTSLFGKNTVIRPNFCKMIDEEKVFMYGQKKKWDLKTYRMKVARLGGSKS